MMIAGLTDADTLAVEVARLGLEADALADSADVLDPERLAAWRGSIAGRAALLAGWAERLRARAVDRQCEAFAAQLDRAAIVEALRYLDRGGRR